MSKDKRKREWTEGDKEGFIDLCAKDLDSDSSEEEPSTTDSLKPLIPPKKLPPLHMFRRKAKYGPVLDIKSDTVKVPIQAFGYQSIAGSSSRQTPIAESSVPATEPSRQRWNANYEPALEIQQDTLKVPIQTFGDQSIAGSSSRQTSIAESSVPATEPSRLRFHRDRMQVAGTSSFRESIDETLSSMSSGSSSGIWYGLDLTPRQKLLTKRPSYNQSSLPKTSPERPQEPRARPDALPPIPEPRPCNVLSTASTSTSTAVQGIKRNLPPGGKLPPLVLPDIPQTSSSKKTPDQPKPIDWDAFFSKK